MKRIITLMCFTLLMTTAYAQTNSYFYGLSTTGGQGLGALFRTDSTGRNLMLLDSFTQTNNGRRPWSQTLLEVNSKLYGVLTNGGLNGNGVFFEYNPANNAFLVKHHFADSTGRFPAGHLVLGSNGKIYGTAKEGGVHDGGTLFEYNTSTEVLTRKASFQWNTTGRAPEGKLIEPASGVIYGTCALGGSKNNGTIFSYNFNSGVLSGEASFSDTATGKSPKGGLLRASNGKLYGMAESGGSGGKGALFEFTISSKQLVKLYNFTGANGRSPKTPLVQLPNGKIYGTTQYGGQSGLGKGVIFEYDIDKDTMVIKRVLGASNIGYYPSGGLVQSAPNKYLILLRTGGPNSFSGTIAE